MLVAICQFELLIPGSNSLKAKRFVLSSLKTRLRNKFNISIAEVDSNDKWQRATLGLSIVANERRFLDQTISQILNHIDDENDVEVIDHQIEIF